MQVLHAVESVNQQQKRVLFDKLMRYFGGDLTGKRIAMWGVAFKPQTDDIREAPSLVLIDLILRAGGRITVYDPVAMDECRRVVGDKVAYAKDMYEAVVDADALLLVTEWKRIPDTVLAGHRTDDALSGAVRRPQHLRQTRIRRHVDRLPLHRGG